MSDEKKTTPAGKFLGGCFLFFFGLPFAGFGGFAFYQGILQAVGRNTVQMTGHPAVFIGVGGLFLLIGLGIAWAGLFGHRYAGLKRPRASKFDDDWKTSKQFPKDRSKRAPRGGRLLRTQTSPLAKFVTLLLVALFWNGISWAVFYQTLSSMGWSWLGLIPLAFTSLFCLIGLLLAGLAVHALFRCLMVGETTMEIDRVPVRPGDRVRLTLRQKGDFEITSLTVRLVCRETVRWQVGTDTHTATEDVLGEVLHETKDARASGPAALTTCEASIPADAMHSFKASHNEIGWGVEVKMDLPGRPDIEEFFEFPVIPEMPR